MISSFQAQQMFAQQNAMFSGQMAYAQQIGHQVNPGMGGPPPPAPFFGGGAAAYGMGAQYGERGAYRAASFGHNVAMPIASAGLGVAAGMGMMGSVGSALFDPFGSALSMGARGWAMGGGGAMGASMGMMGAAAGALPGYLAYKAADVYGGAFMGGVQDQIGMNSMLRQNFRHYGGQGAFNRGFGQQQMGAIGGMMANTARGDLSTSLQELTQITAMGAQNGQFNGARDVQQFTQKFRQMLNTLKTIQSELGGTLTEAAEFMRNANQVGVFRNLDRFASQVRTTSAATNMSQQQVMGLAATGQQISMSMGGRGAQGARGALRVATSLGSALDSGVINNELLSEATGGLQGGEAIQALTGRLMQHTAQFSRRAMGRYSIFGLSNSQGTGLDAAAVDAMLSGGTSVGELSRSAHRNVRGMGRARAINNEGLLRGSLLEQGGLAGQIGRMRMAIGDRVLDQGDDMASLWMQRRMRMSRPEAELMTSLMRNQGTIAQNEAESRFGSRDQVRLSANLQNTRSLDAFTAQLGHSIQEGLGVPEVREAGRRFVTKMSQMSERVMNHLLGIAENNMTAGDRASVGRMGLGRSTAEDVSRISRMMTMGERGAAYDPSRRGIFETGRSVQDMFAARGVRVTGEADSMAAFRAMEDARRGLLTGSADVRGYANLMEGGRGTDRLADALLMARGSGDPSRVYQMVRRMGGTANAADAYAASRGFSELSAAPDSSSMIGRARGSLADLFGSTSEERAASWIASGGSYGRSLGRQEMRAYNAVGNARYQTALRHGRANDVIGDTGITVSEARNTRNLRRGVSGLDEEQVTAVLGSDAFRSSMDRISGMGGNRESINRELSLMQDAAMRATGAEKTTQLAMIRQMRENVARTGSVGREFMRGSTVNAGARDELYRNVGDRASFLSSLGGKWASVGSEFKASFNARNASGSRSADAYRQAEANYSTLVQNISQMSAPERTAELSRLTGLGQNMSEQDRERLSQLRQDISSRGGSNDRLMGRGRRGQRGAGEEAYTLLTAGSVSSVNVGGRDMNTQQIRRALMRGGSQAESVAEQIYQQTGGLGMSRNEYVHNLIGSANGRLDQATANRIMEVGTGAQATEARRSGLERQQRERDPIAAQQLDVLREIRERLPSNPNTQQQTQQQQVGVLQSIANIVGNIGNGDSVPATSGGSSSGGGTAPPT